MSGLGQRLAAIPRQLQKLDPINVPVDQWFPDQPALNNPGLIQAKNCVPLETRTYGPFRKQLQESTNALDSICRGLALTTDQDGEGYIYAGSLTKLYQYRAQMFEDVSRAANYSISNEQRWDFAVFGGNVVATNFNDPLQIRQINGSATIKFEDMITGTNKPTARFADGLRDFLVLGYTQDATDGLRPTRIWWSAFRNPRNFDPDAGTQCDFSDLERGGNVTGVVGGAEYGVIFQEAIIRRMTYVGPPVIFNIEPADRQRGCRIPTSIIPHGRLIFYYGDEGFMAFNGTTSIPIGAGKVDITAANTVDISDSYKIVSTKDPVNKIAMWAFPNNTNTAVRLFQYNWDSGEWGEAEVDLAELLIALSESTTVDSQSFNIDTDPQGQILVDSALWKGGNITLAGVDGANKFVKFTGATLKALFETGERQLFPGQRSQIVNAVPYVDAAATMRIIQRDQQDQSLEVQPRTISPAIPKDANGKCNFRGILGKARYHRAQIEIPEGIEWKHFQGCQVYAKPQGPYQGS